MNNAKLWLVVKPTVGIPLFLSAVAVGSFAVHVAVVLNTDWIETYHGPQNERSAAVGDTILPTSPSNLASAPASMAGERITVILPNGQTAVAVIQADPSQMVAVNALPPPD